MDWPLLVSCICQDAQHAPDDMLEDLKGKLSKMSDLPGIGPALNDVRKMFLLRSTGAAYQDVQLYVELMLQKCNAALADVAGSSNRTSADTVVSPDTEACEILDDFEEVNETLALRAWPTSVYLSGHMVTCDLVEAWYPWSPEVIDYIAEGGKTKVIEFPSDAHWSGNMNYKDTIKNGFCSGRRYGLLPGGIIAVPDLTRFVRDSYDGTITVETFEKCRDYRAREKGERLKKSHKTMPSPFPIDASTTSPLPTVEFGKAFPPADGDEVYNALTKRYGRLSADSFGKIIGFEYDNYVLDGDDGDGDDLYLKNCAPMTLEVLESPNIVKMDVTVGSANRAHDPNHALRKIFSTAECGKYITSTDEALEAELLQVSREIKLNVTREVYLSCLKKVLTERAARKSSPAPGAGSRRQKSSVSESTRSTRSSTSSKGVGTINDDGEDGGSEDGEGSEDDSVTEREEDDVEDGGDSAGTKRKADEMTSSSPSLSSLAAAKANVDSLRSLLDNTPSSLASFESLRHAYRNAVREASRLENSARGVAANDGGGGSSSVGNCTDDTGPGGAAAPGLGEEPTWSASEQD